MLVRLAALILTLCALGGDSHALIAESKDETERDLGITNTLRVDGSAAGLKESVDRCPHVCIGRVS